MLPTGTAFVYHKITIQRLALFRAIPALPRVSFQASAGIPPERSSRGNHLNYNLLRPRGKHPDVSYTKNSLSS
jgi:hypothetical protein